MTIKLSSQDVGPWPMHVYLLVCEETGASAIVDPGADAEKIITLSRGTQVEKILVTHGHPDHVGALADVRQATGAPAFLHPADAAHFQLSYDLPLAGDDRIPIGNSHVRVIHTPGHTPGMVCFDIGDGRILVGDTIFVGGPGYTPSPEAFDLTMETMKEIVFQWPDNAVFYPGHGPNGKIGQERPAFEAFLARGWPPGLHGDVTWE